MVEQLRRGFRTQHRHTALCVSLWVLWLLTCPSNQVWIHLFDLPHTPNISINFPMFWAIQAFISMSAELRSVGIYSNLMSHVPWHDPTSHVVTVDQGLVPFAYIQSADSNVHSHIASFCYIRNTPVTLLTNFRLVPSHAVTSFAFRDSPNLGFALELGCKAPKHYLPWHHRHTKPIPVLLDHWRFLPLTLSLI